MLAEGSRVPPDCVAPGNALALLMAAIAAAMLGGISVLMTLTFGTKSLFAEIGAAVAGCKDKMLFCTFC